MVGEATTTGIPWASRYPSDPDFSDRKKGLVKIRVIRCRTLRKMMSRRQTADAPSGASIQASLFFVFLRIRASKSYSWSLNSTPNYQFLSFSFTICSHSLIFCCLYFVIPIISRIFAVFMYACELVSFQLWLAVAKLWEDLSFCLIQVG